MFSQVLKLKHCCKNCSSERKIKKQKVNDEQKNVFIIRKRNYIISSVLCC